MIEAEKKEFFESHHQPLVQAIVGLHNLLEQYGESTMKTYAKQKVDETYLWATQILHALLADRVKAGEEAMKSKVSVEEVVEAVVVPEMEAVLDAVIQQETGT